MSSLKDRNTTPEHSRTSSPTECRTQTQIQIDDSPFHVDRTSPRPSSPPRIPEHLYSPTRLYEHISPQITLVLDNVGSVARDHLANERTWLAYIRTSLGIAGTGVALVQLFAISQGQSGHQENLPAESAGVERFARPLGATTVFLAISVLGIGVLRYFKVQKALTKGKFPVARPTVMIITAVLAALVAVTFGILVAVPPH